MTTSNVVTVINPKTGEKVSYYLEKWLKDKLDKRVIPDLHKKDKDCIIAIDGKEGCLPKGEKVLMANGSWKDVEEIRMGDLLLSPQTDGTHLFGRVIKLFSFESKETYDVMELHRKKKKLYSCSYNHEIPINKKNNKTKQWEIKHYRAEDFFKKRKTNFHNCTTPTCQYIEKFMNRDNCKIEPYCLGVFLGDGSYSDLIVKRKDYVGYKIGVVKPYTRKFKGKLIHSKGYIKEYNHLCNKGFVRSANLRITSDDYEIMEEVSKFYPIQSIFSKKNTTTKSYSFSLNGNFAKLLEFYNLNGKNSGNKFIPKQALLSDAEYRKKLLAGLIDTDGTLSKSCSYSITTKSEQLAKDIEFLVYSLGGRVSINKIRKSIKSTGFSGEYFRVSFYLGKLKLPIKLKRKVRSNDIFYLSANRTSVKLEKKGKKMVYGFTVDTPSHWFITSNYVITKNSGKSTLGMQLCKYVDPTFNLKRVVFTPEEFREAIYSAKKGQAIMFDEAFTGFSSRSALSGVNRTLVSLMMQVRQKNLFVAIILPTFFLLDKYIAIFRTRVLIHTYECRGVRGYFKIFSSKKKRMLVLDKESRTYSYGVKTKKRGRFYGVFALGTKDVEKKYREKKMKALEMTEKDPMTNSAVKFKEQRNLMLYILKKHTGLSNRKLESFLNEYDFDISYEQIRQICSKFGLNDKNEEDLSEKSDNVEINEDIEQKNEENGLKDPKKEEK
jgi:hypothetical protein